MNIAITSEAPDTDALVPLTFKEAKILMIIDADKSEVTHIYRKIDEENIEMIKKVLEFDCEALICGPLEKEPFEMLVEQGVTRYNGVGHKVCKAYDYMNRYKLDWIADYIGGPGASGHSHSGDCECGEDEAEE